jgi:coenzyme Q-binding protein COQ10
MPGATKSIEINAPIEKVFDVIADFEKYPEFLTEVKEAKISKRQGNECDVDYKVEVMKIISYTIHSKQERPTKLSWTFVKGEFMKDNKGGWILESLGAGKTKATYTIEMALGALVPKTIVNALVETSLPKMLDAFKKRAESR